MKTIVTICLCLYSLFTMAQKNDYIWIGGYGSDEDNSDSSILGWKYGHSIFDFNFPEVLISYDSLAMNFDLTGTSFCGEDGYLLFYSNGIYM